MRCGQAVAFKCVFWRFSYIPSFTVRLTYVVLLYLSIAAVLSESDALTRTMSWIHLLAMEGSYTCVLAMSLHWMSILSAVDRPERKARWKYTRWTVLIAVNVGTGLAYFEEEVFHTMTDDLFFVYYFLALALSHGLVFLLYGCKIGLRLHAVVGTFDVHRLAARTFQVQRYFRISLWGSLVFVVRGAYILGYDKYIVTSKSVSLEAKWYSFCGLYFFVDAVGLTILLLLGWPSAPPGQRNAALTDHALRGVRA